jgi:hypothetical protein
MRGRGIGPIEGGCTGGADTAGGSDAGAAFLERSLKPRQDEVAGIDNLLPFSRR